MRLALAVAALMSGCGLAQQPSRAQQHAPNVPDAYVQDAELSFVVHDGTHTYLITPDHSMRLKRTK